MLTSSVARPSASFLSGDLRDQAAFFMVRIAVDYPSARAHGRPEMILRYSSSVNARVVSVRTLP